jgi:hypothetical protein
MSLTSYRAAPPRVTENRCDQTTRARPNMG